MAYTAFVSAALWPRVLGVLAIALLASGIDDLIPLFICMAHRLGRRNRRVKPALGAQEVQRRIAIFVPCWKESEVIGNMIRHNLAAVDYSNFDFFLGVYPNDPATVRVAEELSGVYRNVHVALCPNPGPTSKADCLNAIYARMCTWEGENGAHFNTVVLHDAEDLIHPDALSAINRERCRYAMVQVPVLPLPTPVSEFTHAIYCDEFAEFQTIDMPARFYSGAFVPSNGVGTGFARHILQRLAQERPAIFNPASLTEDYEIGVYIHGIGHHQLFVPLQRGRHGLVATREYFPRRWKSAVRQRTRWVTGIALQSWERDGWRGSWRTKYWFWRDRKGLLTNPLSLTTNLLTIVGALTWGESSLHHHAWALSVNDPLVLRLCLYTSVLYAFRLSVRMFCVGRLFGYRFASALPLRVVFGNLINCAASCGALLRFARAKVKGEPLVWLKTEHSYPEQQALLTRQRDLRDVLATSGLIAEDRLADLPAASGEDLLDLLHRDGLVTDEERCHALSLQSGLASVQVNVREVKQNIVRTLPVHVEKRFGVVPFSVRNGRLLLAATRVPPPGIFDELRTYTRLPIELRLVTKGNYQELRRLL